MLSFIDSSIDPFIIVACQVFLSLGLGDTSTSLNVFYILLQPASSFSLEFDTITISVAVGGEPSLYGLSVPNGPQKVGRRAKSSRVESSRIES